MLFNSLPHFARRQTRRGQHQRRPVDIWIVELDSGGLRRFTLGGGSQRPPSGDRTASRLYYMSNRTGGPRTCLESGCQWRSGRGAVARRRCRRRRFLQMASIVAGRADCQARVSTSWRVDVRTKQTVAIAATVANESEPAFSPDGRYLAYQSDESGSIGNLRSGVPVRQPVAGDHRRRRTSRAGRREVARSCIETAPRSLPFRSRCSRFRPAHRRRCSPCRTCLPSTSPPTASASSIAQDAENRENVNFVLVTGWFEELKAKMRPSR